MKLRILSVLVFGFFLAVGAGACGDDGGDSDGENNGANNGANNAPCDTIISNCANNGANNGGSFTGCQDACAYLVSCIPDQLTQADCEAGCNDDPNQADTLACVNAAADCTEALGCLTE